MVSFMFLNRRSTATNHAVQSETNLIFTSGEKNFCKVGVYKHVLLYQQLALPQMYTTTDLFSLSN